MRKSLEFILLQEIAQDRSIWPRDMWTSNGDTISGWQVVSEDRTDATRQVVDAWRTFAFGLDGRTSQR